MERVPGLQDTIRSMSRFTKSTNTMNFRAIAERHLLERPSRIEVRLCPDQYVGKVTSIGANKTFQIRQPASERPSNQPCILLVLESPHVSEFKGEPAPANGTTGTSIARYLRMVPGLELTDGFGLILINAVQQQCSLGKPPERFRDKIFREVWAGGGQVYFAARLKRLFRPDDIVVNCCTKGSSSKTEIQLRVLVQHTIASTLLHVSVLHRNHPSFWHVPANRERDWLSVI